MCHAVNCNETTIVLNHVSHSWHVAVIQSDILEIHYFMEINYPHDTMELLEKTQSFNKLLDVIKHILMVIILSPIHARCQNLVTLMFFNWKTIHIQGQIWQLHMVFFILTILANLFVQ